MSLPLAIHELNATDLAQVFDAMNGLCSGVFRGLGRTTSGAVFNFVAFYIIGLPLGYLLAFRLDWGLHGLWSAAARACFVHT